MFKLVIHIVLIMIARVCYPWGHGMVFTKETQLPTYAELEVEEVPLGGPYLKAGAFHLGKYCETTNNEFMLCRQETNDPRYVWYFFEHLHLTLNEAVNDVWLT